jgi:hypothetical protein
MLAALASAAVRSTIEHPNFDVGDEISPNFASLRISSRSYRFIADKYTVKESQARIKLALAVLRVGLLLAESGRLRNYRHRPVRDESPNDLYGVCSLSDS